MKSTWTKDAIAAEIVNRYATGEPLTYTGVQGTSLLSAAMRHFGSWAAAVAYAGLDYDQIRRYRSWSRERIVDRIRELQVQGADLSWNNVSTVVDPQLASAATKKKYFGSWREALEAAGLDYATVRRYQEWTDDRVLCKVRDFHANGTVLNAKSVTQDDICLITAARRRFESWPQTLTAAGLDYNEIVQRAVFRRKRSERRNAGNAKK
jgi:hypothetical protein